MGSTLNPNNKSENGGASESVLPTTVFKNRNEVPLINVQALAYGKNTEAQLTIENSKFKSLRIRIKVSEIVQNKSYHEEDIDIRVENQTITVGYDLNEGRENQNEHRTYNGFHVTYIYTNTNYDYEITFSEKFVLNNNWLHKWFTHNLSPNEAKQIIQELLDYCMPKEELSEYKSLDDGLQFVKKALKLAKKYVDTIVYVKVEELQNQ